MNQGQGYTTEYMTEQKNSLQQKAEKKKCKGKTVNPDGQERIKMQWLKMSKLRSLHHLFKVCLLYITADSQIKKERSEQMTTNS